MINRKSQITLFIIIALVLFIMLGFFLYLASYAVKKKVGEETTKTKKIKIELQPIEHYVTQCLDKTTKEGLTLLGEQGGYIYKSQGGSLIDYNEEDKGLFFINYNDYDVSYGIYPLMFEISPYSPEAPNYPWKTFPYYPDASGNEMFQGVFGISNLPPINSSFGANSIKSQLEFFIKNNIKKCIDWDIFEDYEITENELDVDIGITKEEVIVHLTYPIIIENIATKDKTSIQDFFVREKIRLLDMYYTAYNLISEDIKNISFNIENDAILREGFVVEVMRNVFNKDDIIIVKDLKSLIYDMPYEFVFARHNRMPALYYIDRTEITLPYLYEIKDSDLIPGGISSLKAIDPDEDIINSASFSIEPNVPKILSLTDIDFHIKVSDGALEDYQIIKVISE